MVFDVSKVSGIGEYSVETREVGKGVDAENVEVYKVPGDKVFLVVRNNTLEVRTDTKLSKLLREKFESVMESRYFGRGGIEIVNSGQLSEGEVYDLVRLSYAMTGRMVESDS